MKIENGQMLYPASKEEEARINGMVDTLDAALKDIRATCGFEGEQLDQVTMAVLTSLLWKQGLINPSIPINAIRTLLNMAVDNGFATALGMEVIGPVTERLQ